MKTTTILISILATLALTSASAHAQDDDDLFGDDDQVDPPPGDDDSGTGDTGDTGTGDTGTGDTGTGDAAAGAHNLGIGFATTVGGISSITAGGLGVEYWIGDKLAFNGIGRVLFFSPDVDGADSVLAIQIGVGALFVLKQRGRAMLLGGGRFLLGFTSGNDGTTSIGLEAPLRLQMRLADRLSANVEGGVAIGIGDQGALNPVGGGGESFTLLIGSRNVFGSAGLTAYF
jgi:hypothetical protein